MATDSTQCLNGLGFLLRLLGDILAQLYRAAQVSDSFPFKWINKKWKEGFYVTSMATSHTRWAVVMSRNAGFIDQCVELDFQYPSEGIHRRWDAGSAFAAFCMPVLSFP